MIIAVLFFIFISLALVVALASPALSHLRVSSALLSSLEAFSAAEAGMEDAVYRFRWGMNVPNPIEIEVGGASAEVVHDIDEMVEIISEGVASGDSIRRSRTLLDVGEGFAFNYGIQVGTGGFEIRNATVFGNVFGIGNVVGTHSGSTVTGSAFAANRPEEDPNVRNDHPPSPEGFITFGNQDATQDIAQSFTVSADGVLSKIEVYIRKVGSPRGLTVYVVENDPVLNEPSTEVVGQSAVRAGWVTDQYGWVEMYFPSTTFMEAGELYWIVLAATPDPGRYYQWGTNDASYPGNPTLGIYGVEWSEVNVHDAYFRVYLEGEKSFVDNLNVGEDGAGDAWAYEVRNSDVEADILCQIGSGNNKPCDDSGPDPDPREYPVSPGNIIQWKADAEDGGVIEGNYVADNNSTLGPVKIDGDLTLEENNSTLTLTGTVWVTGNITLPNGSTVALDPSYGKGSGLLIADGFVHLENNINFVGSGDEESFIMLLTTSDCPASDYCNGEQAISVRNNAGAVILNAQNGTVHFNNNAGAKEATAHRIVMENNSEVEYESGLADVNFVSGPGGGYVITEWIEIE